MSDYTIPPINNLPFNFGVGGYQTPAFNAINFRTDLRPTYNQTAELQSAISVMQLYQDTTYTYTKACRTVVIGYSTNGIQTLQLPCEYAGIRDIGSYIYVLPTSVDLGAYVGVIDTILNIISYIRTVTESTTDLPKFIRTCQPGQQDLVNIIHAFYRDSVDFSSYIKIFLGRGVEKDLPNFIRTCKPGQQDLLNAIGIFHKDTVDFSSRLTGYLGIGIEKDLSSSMYIWQASTRDLVNAIRILHKDSVDFSSRIKIYLGVEIEQELTNYIYSIPPKNLSSILNIISINNLPNTIEGVWLKGSIDLHSQVPSISFRGYTEIVSSLHSWQEVDLEGEIHPNTIVDLSSHMIAGTFGIALDILSYVKPVLPVQLSSNIYGLASKDLNTTLVSGYDQGFIHVYINSVTPIELKSRLMVYKEQRVERNLHSYVEVFYTRDLGGLLRVVTPIDLGSYINSSGKSMNLGAEIIPMIIRMSTVFQVSLLEHKNLPSLINYGCKLSGYKDLSSYIYPYMKRELKSIIVGWHFDFADNVRDLKAYINAGDVLVEDKLNIAYFNDPPAYTKLDVHYTLGDDVYKVIDSLVVAFSNKDYATLTSYVYGHPHAADLHTRINAQIQSNFTTTPEWVNPKTTEVFINIKRFEDRWTRFVDLMFTTGLQGENYYFYVSGAEYIYKVNKDQKWVLWVTGYNKDTGVMAERNSVRRKFIFNLRDYATMDHAIRDMMDRVVEYRKSDLTSTIASYLPIHANLNSTLNSIFTYRWTKNVKATIKSIQFAYYNITTSISSELYKDDIELSSLIEGKSYAPPSGDNIDFIFEAAEYTAPVIYNTMDWTWRQIED